MVNFKCRECNRIIYPNKQSLSIVVVSKKNTMCIILFCDEKCMGFYKYYVLDMEENINMKVYKKRWFPKLLRKIERDFWNATRNTD